jgi:sulfide:quinone oxidoreductase
MAAGRFRVAIVGGGVAGVTAMMALAEHLDGAGDVDLITPWTHFVLNQQLIGEPWGGPPLRVGLGGLAAEFGAVHRPGTVDAIGPGEGELTTTDGEIRRYDAILVATGAKLVAPYPEIDTVGLGSVPAVLAHPERGSVALVVPPGIAWTLPAYQLALLAASADRPAVRVITPEQHPLDLFGPAAVGVIADFLTRHRVGVERGRQVRDTAEARALADHVVALPLVRGVGIANLPADPDGFLTVDATQRVSGLDTIFAAGDATAASIKQGGLAAHQAEVAALEIAELAGRSPVRTNEPATLRGKLVAGGDTLYLRRRLEDAEHDRRGTSGWRADADPGTARETPPWRPEAALLAWRLSLWLEEHRRGLGADPLGPVARP